jgi:hypothetical protein
MLVCPACNRHVRESACPFCGAAVPEKPERARSVGHHTRAVLALGAAASVSAALLACSTDSTSSSDKDSGFTAMPAYGGSFPNDASFDGTSDVSADATTSDGPSASPAYGIAVDASQQGDASDQ